MSKIIRCLLGLLKGVGAESVSESIVLATAADSFSRLSIIREDNDSLTVGTAGLFHCGGEKLGFLLPQPEGKAGSKGTVEDIARLDSFSDLQRSPTLRASDSLHTCYSPKRR